MTAQQSRCRNIGGLGMTNNYNNNYKVLREIAISKSYRGYFIVVSQPQHPDKNSRVKAYVGIRLGDNGSHSEIINGAPRHCDLQYKRIKKSAFRRVLKHYGF